MVLSATINYAAVLVATFVSMFIGMMWYGPLFGKQWMKMTNMSKGSMKKMPLTAGQAVLGGFIATLVSVYVLAHFIDYVGATTATAGMQLGFWVWLGFIGPITLGSFLWEGKSFKLWFFNNAQNVLTLLISGAILAVWI